MNEYKEYYAINGNEFCLEKTSSGYWKLTEHIMTDEVSFDEYEYTFPNKENAIQEIISYSFTPAEDCETF